VRTPRPAPSPGSLSRTDPRVGALPHSERGGYHISLAASSSAISGASSAS